MNPFLTLLLVSILFLLSLFGSYIVFKLLKGKATFEHQGLKFGGAAAGFLVFFWLLSKVFFTAIEKFPVSIYPALEVIALGKQGEKILTEVVLDPKKLIVSLEKFKSLDPEEHKVLSDSFNIAVAPPKEYNWSFGKLPDYTTLATKDSPFFDFLNKANGGKLNFEPKKAEYFGARVGIPTELIIEANSRIDGVKIAENPFKNRKFFLDFSQSINVSLFDPHATKLTDEELDSIQVMFIKAVDRSADEILPIKRNIYSGVYVTVYNENSFSESPLINYISGREYLTKAVAASAPYSRDLPRLSYLNGDERIAAYNKSVQIKGAIVNGTKKDLIINYVGIAVGGDNAVYTITLQYLSTDSAEVLRELQRYFESVRIVRPDLKVKGLPTTP